MKKLVNVGVVGCGYWGPNLIRNFNALPNCHVRSICDQDQSRLDHMQELYPGSEVTRDFDHLVHDSELDAIVVATPVYLHHELALRALEAGKHVFIEKPMASSVRECQELVSVAERNKSTLMVGHTFVYTSAVRKIKEIVDSGELGEMFYISSRRLNLGLFQKDINVAWDLAPHDISIILHIMGENPASVNCQGKSHITPGIEDVTNMTLDFPSGGFATIHSSWLDPNKTRNMAIVGSKKMIAYDDIEPLEKLKIYDKRVETPPHYDTFAEFQYSYHYGDMHAPYLKQTEPLRDECGHFVECILTGSRPETSGWDGMNVVKILEAASESLRIGGGKVEVEEQRFYLTQTATG